ncbi:tRNA (N6-threonylcarbamoyladenosine(37)-N6)-methyltransferase TrmO [Roseibacillus persicicus]|uniref:tRNA (N6-threonylcarbamoyladenosine(37)-N6)-methyltransferase TrmO n=1 Tax=Roseibacillus persicicus TaxID=454148 RepID=UPI00280FAE78|nr:tRNA (N6-threonylcarbamoyladenosine(37)-N6)-methyltransferase TrmO [Roseibacillus persicicus]MDQ8189474.1 tRNA (N6-threonylcarbamoyladenosine(37)-N6)-methyltransferase TrmO [Roseibacillus persicicus]
MSDGSVIAMQPIAYLRSPWVEKFGVPRQPGLIREAWGEVEFVEEFAKPEAREGLEGFSHLWVTFLFDRVPPDETRLRVRPPRLGGNDKIGVFATRSPFRPNRIGLSVCEIESVFPTLRLRGVDIVDGTPILDIRPYVSYVDSVPDAVAGFAPDPPLRVPVSINPMVSETWNAMDEEEQRLIEGMISLRPGPAYQTGSTRVYRARIGSREVAWAMGDEGAEVRELT